MTMKRLCAAALMIVWAFCAVAAGYSDFTPAPLPGSDDDARIIRLE